MTELTISDTRKFRKISQIHVQYDAFTNDETDKKENCHICDNYGKYPEYDKDCIIFMCYKNNNG
jgi:hypothetical protein